MHASPADFLLWIVNPILRASLLWRMYRWRTIDLKVFSAYQAFYILADITMLVFYFLQWPTCFLFGSWIFKTIIFAFQVAIGNAIMWRVNEWRKRSLLAWLVVCAGLILMFKSMAVPGWSSYVKAMQWTDAACCTFVMSAAISDRAKWKPPYPWMAYGLITTVVLDLGIRVFTPEHPGALRRMLLQATLTIGILVWMRAVSPPNRAKKLV